MDKFQDIMPLEPISIEYGFYIFYLILFILVGIAIYIYVKILFKKRELLEIEQTPIEKLKALDLDRTDTKQLLYDFTLLAKKCETDGLDEILKEIEPYKYKKEEMQLDKKTKELLKRYIDAI